MVIPVVELGLIHNARQQTQSYIFRVQTTVIGDLPTPRWQTLSTVSPSYLILGLHWGRCSLQVHWWDTIDPAIMVRIWSCVQTTQRDQADAGLCCSLEMETLQGSFGGVLDYKGSTEGLVQVVGSWMSMRSKNNLRTDVLYPTSGRSWLLGEHINQWLTLFTKSTFTATQH